MTTCSLRSSSAPRPPACVASRSAQREVPCRCAAPSSTRRHLNDAGNDAVHTLDLPEQNRTTDAEVSRVADAQDRIVVSKDSDFRDSHLLNGTPARLLVVSTGNITNRDLIALIDDHLPELVAAFQRARLVQLTTDDMLILDED